MRELIALAVAALAFQPAEALVIPTFRFDGNPLGVMDSHGREIIPARYSRVRYLGHGIFLMGDIAPGLVEGKKLEERKADSGKFRANSELLRPYWSL